jgi:phytoene synthase
MEIADPDRLLALAYAGRNAEKLRVLFAIDESLGRVVSSSREPAIAQLKLAWWRENLIQSAGNANKGEQLLAAAHAFGLAPDLVAMVNGWEVLLGELPLSDTELLDYAIGRGGVLFDLAARFYAETADEAARNAGRAWALTDFAFRCSDATTRDRALALAAKLARPGALPLPLGIISALVRADLARGLTGRWAPGSPKRIMRAFSYFLFRR